MWSREVGKRRSMTRTLVMTIGGKGSSLFRDCREAGNVSSMKREFCRRKLGVEDERGGRRGKTRRARRRTGNGKGQRRFTPGMTTRKAEGKALAIQLTAAVGA